MKHINTLERIGLSKSEANLYLTNLKMGPATAIQLGQKLNLSRQMIYTLLPALQERGLVKQVMVGTRRLFQATDPSILSAIAEESVKSVKEAIPALKSLQAENNAIPLISVYENPLAMREWYETFMQQAGKGDEMLIWSTGELWYNLDQAFYEKFTQFKSKNEIRDLIIAPNTPEAHQVAQSLASHNREYRFTDSWWHTKGEMWVWNNQIVYLTLKENATNLIVIESDALAAIERFNFRNTWQQLKKSISAN